MNFELRNKKQEGRVIKNFGQLATSMQRKQALTVAEAGFEAINTRKSVKKQFIYDAKKQKLTVMGRKFNLPDYKKIVCVGFGKAALEAVTEIQQILKDKITCGYVLDLKEGDLGNIVCRVGTHPLPTKVNIEATKELLEMLKTCTKEDLVICVVSGGGSALLCQPYEISCEMEMAIISALTVKAASIGELNTVRKHISRVKGGHLAEIIYPATCISLIFSDVPGDDISMVASGPTVKDVTTNESAAKILKKYDILEMCQIASCRLLETPKDEKYFERVHNFLVVSAKQALSAMREKAEDLGFKVKIYSYAYQGEAKKLAEEIVKSMQKGVCLLGVGESTVKITGSGKGGRNQEMALSALPLLSKNQVLICAASDGYDNTEAAGAVVDETAFLRAKALGLDPKSYLNNNDSFTFFEELGSQLNTGPTGANVSDFFVALE